MTPCPGLDCTQLAITTMALSIFLGSAVLFGCLLGFSESLRVGLRNNGPFWRSSRLAHSDTHRRTRNQLLAQLSLSQSSTADFNERKLTLACTTSETMSLSTTNPASIGRNIKLRRRQGSNDLRSHTWSSTLVSPQGSPNATVANQVYVRASEQNGQRLGYGHTPPTDDFTQEMGYKAPEPPYSRSRSPAPAGVSNRNLFSGDVYKYDSNGIIFVRIADIAPL
jgi:hypothetical protein